MKTEKTDLRRREFVRMAAGCSLLTLGDIAAHGEPRATIPLFDGRTLDGWIQIENNATSLSTSGITTGWVVKDGAMASTGVGRGVIYTAKDYGRFRLMFTMRHVTGNPDHQACVLIFCTRPPDGEKPLDALGGIQFQVPNGGHWDYRPGMNNDGGPAFTSVAKAQFDVHAWSRVEI